MPLSKRLSALTQQFLEQSDKCAELEKSLTEENKALESTEQNLFSAMIDEELSSFKTDNGITITRKIRTFHSVNKSDSEALIDWLKSVGGEGIIKTEPTVNSQTLSSFIKEQEFEQIPAFIKAFDKRSISARKT